MKNISLILVLLFMSLTCLADGTYYGFLVENAEPHTLIKNVKKKAVNQTPTSYMTTYKKTSAVFFLVPKSVYDSGYDALTQEQKDGYVDAVESYAAEAENSSIDAQALIDVVAELTGTPVNDVKQKFKTAKKNKEKNK